jgi:hypothetical protein
MSAAIRPHLQTFELCAAAAARARRLRQRARAIRAGAESYVLTARQADQLAARHEAAIRYAADCALADAAGRVITSTRSPKP